MSFRLASCASVIPKRFAIVASVSPERTTYRAVAPVGSLGAAASAGVLGAVPTVGTSRRWPIWSRRASAMPLRCASSRASMPKRAAIFESESPRRTT
jgi:hypothetical protein